MTGLKKLVPLPVRVFVRSLLNNSPVKIEIRPPRPHWPGETQRYGYQQQHIDFDIQPNDRVLDIGSGGDPFPHATHLVDRFLEPTEHRYGPLVRENKPLILADITRLPFRDKSFDFVYCCHLLEHVADPLKACQQIMRIGKRGYIETPTMGIDLLFAWAKEIHKWHVVGCGGALCFFEYSPRQLEGIRATTWQEIILDKRYHPLQDAFYQNQDIFNVMFPWVESFKVFVFHLDGRIESLNDG